jgi:hypothetical protein
MSIYNSQCLLPLTITSRQMRVAYKVYCMGEVQSFSSLVHRLFNSSFVALTILGAMLRAMYEAFL